MLHVARLGHPQTLPPISRHIPCSAAGCLLPTPGNIVPPHVLDRCPLPPSPLPHLRPITPSASLKSLSPSPPPSSWLVGYFGSCRLLPGLSSLLRAAAGSGLCSAWGGGCGRKGVLGVRDGSLPRLGVRSFCPRVPPAARGLPRSKLALAP